MTGAARFLNSIYGNLVGTVNGFTIGKSVPADAKFTDTITTASTTGSGNAVTAVTSTNGALTVTKGTTFLTSVNAPRYVNLGSISSLPGTWDVTGITTDMVCSEAILGTPAAQTGDWTVNTDTAGQITVSGSISGTTTVTLVMVPSISVTGVKK